MNLPVISPTVADLQAFVANEACCLDEQRWDDWAALFDPESWYWLPASSHHSDPLAQASHLYDDSLLRRVKLLRLQSPQAHSQKPAGRCHHLLQTTTVPARDDAAGVFTTRTAFHYVETRLDQQTLYAGWALHTLVMQEGALKIRLKRVDLVNSDAAFGSMQLFM